VVRLEARLERRTDADDRVEAALRQLRPGSIVYANKGKYRGPVAVVATAHRKAGLRLTTITPSGDNLQLSAEDFADPPRQVGSIGLPPNYAPNRREYRREVGRRIRGVRLQPRGAHGDRSPGDPGTSSSMHPVEADPDLRQRLRAAAHAERVAAEIADLERRVVQHHQSLAQDFERVLGVLSAYGYVDVERWELTDAGAMLARVFHESDLLVTECIRQGLLDGLDPAELAGLTSLFVYEHRSPDDPPAPWFPSPEVTRRSQRIIALSAALASAETAAELSVHRAPDPTFLAIAYAWVAGEGFAEVLGDDELTGGDFVRTMKQLIDLLQQVAVVAPDEGTRRAARRAADAAFRGVIADSSAPGGAA
jgi:ATP-dependent RNA helicase HelY